MGILLRRAAAAGALAALVLASPDPVPAASPGERLPEFRAPLRAAVLARLGRASFRHSESDLGTPALAFDGNPGTVLRTRGSNPAFLEVAFDAPKEVLSAELLLAGEDPHEWSLLAGDDPGRLREVFARRRIEGGAWSRVERFTPALRARVFRVVATSLARGNSISFAEVSLDALQRPEGIRVAAPSTVACPSGDLVIGARVTWDGGYRSNAVSGRLWFDLPEDSVVSKEQVPPVGPPVARLRYRQSGRTVVTARIGSRQEGIASPPFEVEARSQGRPDWSVSYIERMPRLEFDGPGGGLPAIGASVTWRAHVRNCGTMDAPRVPVRWTVDGNAAGDAWLEGVERYEEQTVDLRIPWDGNRHEVRLAVDPTNAHEEGSEGNNSCAVASDALLIGLWAERPVVEAFLRLLPAFGDGVVTFEDWAQRQVATWNGLLAGAVHPLVPKGCTDRVALDYVRLVEEGDLPLGGGLPANDPDARDRTVDLQWGFPATLLDRGPGDRREGEVPRTHYELLRALSRARYLADLDRLDVRAEEILLDAPDGRPLAGSPWLPSAGGDLVHRTRSGGLMAGQPAEGYGEHSAWALERIARHRARGGNRSPSPVQGEYLADLPRVLGIRVVDGHGRSLDGVRVRAWRRAPDDDGREAFSGEPVREGTTIDGGAFDLGLHGVDPFFDGAREPPFDASRGVLLLELSRKGVSAWRFLEIVPFNLAFARGAREAHYEEIRLDLPR